MKATLSRLGRFAVLSGASFIINVGLTALLHEIWGLSEELSFAIALATQLSMSFLACRYYVFSGAGGDVRRQIMLFVVSSMAFRALEYLAFLVVHTGLGAYYLAAIVAILGASALVKFVYYRRVVFESHMRPKSEESAGKH